MIDALEQRLGSPVQNPNVEYDREDGNGYGCGYCQGTWHNSGRGYGSGSGYAHGSGYSGYNGDHKPWSCRDDEGCGCGLADGSEENY